MDDPFDMNIKFFDGETPINDFKSKREFIDKELELEACKFFLKKISKFF